MRKANAFTRLLSYFWDQRLETASSAHNEYLEVMLSSGRYRLNTANATYSHEDLYHNFYRAFKRLNFEELELKNALVLGLGLGSVPLMLYKYFGQKSTRFVGVDIDEIVLQLAKKYLPPEVDKNINYRQADAFDFVIDHTKRYDLIAVDVFLDMETPQAFRKPQFLHRLPALLQPDGYLLYNLLTITPQLRAQAETFYKQTFAPIFPGCELIPVSGNRMLVWKKGAL